jgi:hypothetical protein
MLMEYLLWVPNSIVRPPARPAGLLASDSDSGTGPRIEPNLNHTQALAGLFTAAWQYPCQCLSAWALALAACWGIPSQVQELLWVSFTRLAATMISCLLTSSTSSSQQRCACCEQACEGPGLQVGASESMMSCRIFTGKQSYKVQVQRFYQSYKTKSWPGLKLSSADGDWDVNLGSAP